MKPDLRWIQDQLAAEGLDFDHCRNDAKGFACQCPVHKGGDKSARFAVRNGVLLFHCYAYGCSFKDVKDVLDLTDGDCYSEAILRDRARRRPDPSFDDCLVMVAENDLRQGKRLEPGEMEKYQMALLRKRGVVYAGR